MCLFVVYFVSVSSSNPSVFFLAFEYHGGQFGRKGGKKLLIGIQQICAFDAGWCWFSSLTTIRGLTGGRTGAIRTLVKVEKSIVAELGCKLSLRGSFS